MPSTGEGQALMDEKEQRTIIVTPQPLLEKIDQYRDELSRAEFIAFCIESFLEGGREAAPSREEMPSTPGGETEWAEGVSRQEFEEFARRIKNMQKVFIEFMLNYGLEHWDRAPSEVQEKFRADVARLPGVVSQAGKGGKTVDGNGSKVQVMLLDDRVLLREGLHSVLEAEEDIEVVAEASSADEAISYQERLNADVVVVRREMAPALRERLPETRLVLMADGTEDGLQEPNGEQARCFTVDVAPGALLQAIRGYPYETYQMHEAREALKGHLLSLVDRLYPASV